MLHIYVLDRGWVVIGERDPNNDHPHWGTLLRFAAVVRRWGTTAGLGQLAAYGPRDETVLDKAPQGIIVPPRSMIGPVLPCNEEAWQRWRNEYGPGQLGNYDQMLAGLEVGGPDARNATVSRRGDDPDRPASSIASGDDDPHEEDAVPSGPLPGEVAYEAKRGKKKVRK